MKKNQIFKDTGCSLHYYIPNSKARELFVHSIESSTFFHTNLFTFDRFYNTINFYFNFTGDETDFKEENYTEENFEQYSHEYLSRNSDFKDEDQFEHFSPDDDNSLDSGSFTFFFIY